MARVGQWLMWQLLKIGVAYLLFGVAFAMVQIAYCNYRASAGNPSDLLLWTPMVVSGWPLMALGDVLHGYATFVPAFWVRTVGIAFLAGFIATLAWVLRTPTRAAP